LHDDGFLNCITSKEQKKILSYYDSSHTQIYKLLQTQSLILPVILLMDMTPFTHNCVNNVRIPLLGTAISYYFYS